MSEAEIIFRPQSAMSSDAKTIWYYNPEDSHLNTHYYENLISSISKFMTSLHFFLRLALSTKITSFIVYHAPKN